MKRLALAILVVALGAVRAEAQDPTTPTAKLVTSTKQAVLGTSMETKLVLGECCPGNVYLFFGTPSGSSTVTIGSLQVPVPLGGNPQLVGSGALTTTSPIWRGYTTLPTTSPLLGQMGALTAVVVHKNTVRVVSLAASIGPIIEDGLM